MAAQKNENFPKPRKSLRSIRRSELARMSGDLNPDSNIYSDEDEHPLWWKDIENNTVNLRSLDKTVYDSQVLDSNSDVAGSPLQKSWYKHLDQTRYSSRRSSVPKKPSSNVADDKSSRLTDTSLTADIIHKKRSKFHVKKRPVHQPEFETILNAMSESTRLSTRGNTPKYAVDKTDDGTDSSLDNHDIKKIRRLPFKKPLKPPGAQSSVTAFEDALDGTIEEETSTKSKEVSNTVSAKSSDIPIQPDISALARRRSKLPTADRSTDTSAETAKLNLFKRRRMFTKKRKRISVNYENLWTSNEDSTDVTASQKSGYASTIQQREEKIMPEKALQTDHHQMQNLSPTVRRSYKRQKLSTPRMVESAPVKESLNTQEMEASDIDLITPSPPSSIIKEANIEIAATSRSQINKPRIRSIQTVQNELVKLKQRYHDNEDSSESDDQLSLELKLSEKSNETIPPKNTKNLQTDTREARSLSRPLLRSNRDEKLSTSHMTKSANSAKQLHTQSMEESDIEAVTSATLTSTIHEEHIESPATNRSKTNNSKVRSVESRQNKTPISPDKLEDGDYSNRSKTNNLQVRSVESQRNKTSISSDKVEDDDYSNRSKTNSLQVRSVESRRNKTPVSPDNSEDKDSIETVDHAVIPLQSENTPRSVYSRSEEGRQLYRLHQRNMTNFDESASAATMEESDIDPVTSSASSSIISEKNSQITNKSKSGNNQLQIRSIDTVQGKVPKDSRWDIEMIPKLDDNSSRASIHASSLARQSIQETDESFPAPKTKKTSRSSSSRSYTHHDKVPDPQNDSHVLDASSRSKSSKKADDKGELDPVNLSSSHSPVTTRRELRSHSRKLNISEPVNDSIKEKDIDKRSRSIRDFLKMDTIYERTSSIDQSSRPSNSTKSKKSMETKKPTTIVQTPKTPKANEISKIIESAKEIENNEPVEMDQPSRVRGAIEAVEFQESVEPDRVTATAKTAPSTANNTTTSISRTMRKEKSIAKPNPPKNDNLLSQLQSLSEHENDDKWEKAKRALEDVKKKQMALMKMAPIDSYFKAISRDKSVMAGNSQKSGNKPSQKATSVATSDKSTPPNVNKAYIVNGQVYKRPKLPRPKAWVTDRMYKFLFKQLEPHFRINTRVRAEKFVRKLSEAVSIITRRKKYANYEAELNSLIEEMAQLNLIKTLHDFHLWCQDFMPYDFRIKVVPMLLPGNVRNIPFHPEKLHEPILHEE